MLNKWRKATLQSRMLMFLPRDVVQGEPGGTPRTLPWKENIARVTNGRSHRMIASSELKEDRIDEG